MANNPDRLFRENLDQLEITPSAEGWNQVRDQITKKKSGWIIPVRVAAAVTIVLTTTITLLILGESTGGQQPISSIDHPIQAPALDLEINIPEQNQIAKKTGQSIKQNLVDDNKIKEKINSQEQEEGSAVQIMSTLVITGINRPLIGSDFSTKNLKLVDDQHEPELPSIKITYIASEESASDSTKTSKISKVFAFAKDVSGSDLLADLRDAKNNLFKRN